MLAQCNKCRDQKDIKLKVENPENLKINRTTIANSTIKLEPVCTACGTTAKLSQFFINHMVDKREFLSDKNTKTSKSKCQACQTEQEIKLDRQKKPRCMRCGGVVAMSTFMVNTYKSDPKRTMSAEELARWSL